MVYEAVYYDGNSDFAGYVLIDGVEGDTPEQALAIHIDSLTSQVIEMYGFEDSASTRNSIQKTLYLLRPNGLVSLSSLERATE
ncbi:MAG: hypothetical protein IT331_09990 [Anaerolineae bacterium]|nr:hypothetical protein [Anaerolineae bacterium]